MKIKLIVLYLSLASFIGSIGMESTVYAQDSKGSQTIGSSEKKSNKTDKKKNINKRRSSKKKYEGEAQLNFVESEDGYWNARNISDPAFTGNGASLNSVMFESRPGRKVESLPQGPVRDSDVEFVGGKSMEIVVDGREIKTEDGQNR